MNKNKGLLLWIGISAVVMLVLPLLAIVFAKGDAGMAVCFLLFYAVNPLYCAAVGMVSGKDVRSMGFMPVVVALLYLAGTWTFFDMGELAFVIYAGLYLVIGFVAMLLSSVINRKLFSKRR